MGQIIAMTGGGGSGKSTLTVNLACALAEKQKVVIILSAELSYGTLQTFFKEVIERDKGTLASLIDKTEQPEKLLTQCKSINNNIYLMGIPNDNYEIFSDNLEEEKIEQLIRRLSIIADYLIVDCTSDWYNGISIMGIEKANYVCCNYKANAASVMWFKSAYPIINQLTNGQVYNIISEHQMGCHPGAFGEMLGEQIFAYLPNVIKAPLHENMGKPIYYDKEKLSLIYKKAITDMAGIIIEGKGKD